MFGDGYDVYQKRFPAANSPTDGRSHSPRVESVAASIIARVRSMRKIHNAHLAEGQPCAPGFRYITGDRSFPPAKHIGADETSDQRIGVSDSSGQCMLGNTA